MVKVFPEKLLVTPAGKVVDEPEVAIVEDVYVMDGNGVPTQSVSNVEEAVTVQLQVMISTTASSCKAGHKLVCGIS